MRIGGAGIVKIRIVKISKTNKKPFILSIEETSKIFKEEGIISND
jgi:hypothetical protein